MPHKRVPEEWINELKRYGYNQGALLFNSGANVDTCSVQRGAPTNAELSDWVDPYKRQGVSFVVGYAFDEITRCGEQLFSEVCLII